uniref:(northern house mosquito) hypothetical protein n=1 Tax=Culex pipiens TaxID=7175 RepID=A0A8D8GGX2_CULPI
MTTNWMLRTKKMLLLTTMMIVTGQRNLKRIKKSKLLKSWKSRLTVVRKKVQSQWLNRKKSYQLASLPSRCSSAPSVAAGSTPKLDTAYTCAVPKALRTEAAKIPSPSSRPTAAPSAGSTSRRKVCSRATWTNISAPSR